MAGSFVFEQAKAMAELPDIRMAISLWGQLDLEIQPRNARTFFSFYRRIKEKNSFAKRFEGFYEVYRPVLYWSHRLPFGGVKRLYEANLNNFYEARDELGEFDLIHAHVGYPAGCLAESLSRRTGIPYVLTEHMGPFPFPSLVKNGNLIPELLSAYSNASRVIAVSPAQAAMMQAYGVPDPVVIPNFVDEREFCCAAPPDGKFIFLTVCSLVSSKGVADLLKAISLWRPSSEKVEFHIVGSGPGYRFFLSEASRMGVSDLVTWHGSIPRGQISSFFKKCHAFVMPSHHESFGMVYAEAIACGKPVIATRCGGAEFIVNDLNGRLVDVGDIESLACALSEVWSNWSLFSASEIRKDFMSRFSRAAVARSLRQVYAEVSSDIDN